MGIKEFLGRAAGPGAFGRVVGNSAVQNGIELGRILYLGHGTAAVNSQNGMLICESAEEMQTKGFDFYCPDISNKPAAEDKSQLSIHCRAACIALASQMATSGSTMFFSKPENNIEFCRALWGGIRQVVIELHSELTFELVEIYLGVEGAGSLKVITPKLPGSDDVFGLHLAEVARRAQVNSIAFRRSGILGFGKSSFDLWEDSVKKLHEASVNFRW